MSYREQSLFSQPMHPELMRRYYDAPRQCTKVVVSKALADAAKRHFGLTDEQMADMFIVTTPIATPIDPREALNRKALHRQELDRLRKRR